MPAMDESRHPFALLTPDLVLDALATLGLMGDGRLLALNSYENRVYLAHLEPGTRLAEAHPALVLKFYRPGRWSAAQIAEEHAFAQELAAAEVPVVAPLAIDGQTLHAHGGFHFSVSPRRGGRAPEPGDLEALEWIGRFLARLHEVGARRRFTDRPAVDLAGYGHEPRDWLLAHGALPLEVEREWADASGEVLAWIGQHADWRAAAHPGVPPGRPITCLRLHADCHWGNILWTPTDQPGGGPHFVDLDDCRSGPAVQDLWMLLAGERAERQRQLGALLDGYEQARPFDRRELALIEPLRTLRLIHYSAWLARRWNDPAFPAAFPAFGTPDYWRGQVRLLRQQLEAMQEPPLVA
ncbi:MAG TPA: serine/threonine protein kinase [Ottowia sp.]|uniref:serine/threonine protein kinase n=1 Tax=Ottowia sp. TaxID=1898956 RepID=UPI002CE02357|nr:serine/threonine protein kinase [Ottowia sp.]HMN22619.1 serine/threonine protein kinase [Ottowia sp.]